MQKLITTSDGSHTIFVPELNEHYHSVHGAVQESNFIFIENGFNFSNSDPINIFEVGLGTGLNVLLTVVRNKDRKRKVFYTSIEKYPVDKNIIEKLNYHNFAGSEADKLFTLIHSSPWDEFAEISENFSLRKINGDITKQQVYGNFDLIYFDAFGPDKQPDMWTIDIFEGIAENTNKDGVLVTYSAKGELKRNLRACGFEVYHIPGPPGKRQITRAIKK